MTAHEYQATVWRQTYFTLLGSCLLLFATALPVAHADSKLDTLDFALIGDAPYTAAQRVEYVNLLKATNAENLAFVVHNGDFWFDGIQWNDTMKGFPPCADETFSDRYDLAKTSKHPFILTPGDNDWTDCHRAKPRTYDPIERLAKLREMYFSGEQSLGQRTIKLTRQSNNRKYAQFRENVRWTYGNVQFMTLHMVGSNNNLGRTPVMDAEYKERNAANLAWMQETFEMAKHNGNLAIMIISQANPYFENTWSDVLKERYLLKGLGIKPPRERTPTGFDDFLKALEELVVAYGKPVVYVHGDTHTFRIDKPLVRTPAGKRPIENFTRVETFGYPNTHWVRVTIDAGDPNVFRFNPVTVPENVTRK